MAQEIVRELVAGVWRTVRRQQAGGGGSQTSATWKEACAAATTKNLVALAGLLTVDFYTLEEGDRVLVADQDTGLQNGIYVASAGAWARADDANTNGSIATGAKVPIGSGGNSYAGAIFTVTPENDPWVPGTDALNCACIAAQPGLLVSVIDPDAGSTRADLPAGETHINVLILPASDPMVVGALWNDGGTPAISEGP